MIASVRVGAGLARLLLVLFATLTTIGVATAQKAQTSLSLASTRDYAPATNVDEIIGRVVHGYAAESKGVVGVRSRSMLRVDAPMNHRKTSTTNWYVYDDGRLVATSEAPDPRRPPLHDPLRSRHRGEYRFKPESCADCPAGAVAIGYSSPTHDEVHAHGTMIVDVRSAHVLHASEVPYAFPRPTHDGKLAITWGKAEIGWFPTHVSGEFSGRVGPFSGVAHYDQMFAPYARYASADAAVSTLVAQTRQPRASNSAH